MRKASKSPFLVGWESVKANVVPSLALWLAAAGMVLAYFFLPCASRVLEPVAQWHGAHEELGTIANRILFCGVIPGLCMLAIPSIRPVHPWRTLASETAWYAALAIVCGYFYRLQSELFGMGNDIATLMKKMLVDQFVWTVFVIAPMNAAFFFWAGRDFSFRRMIESWPENWFCGVYLPNLLANWCTWIPVVAIIYAFPLALQIQVSGFIGSFWTLLSLEIGRRSGLSSA